MVGKKPDPESTKKEAGQPVGGDVSGGEVPDKKSAADSGEVHNGKGKREKGPLSAEGEAGKPAASKVPPPEKAVPGKKPGTGPPPRPPRSRGPSFEALEDDPLLTALREVFGDEKISGQSFLEQRIYTVDSDILYDAMLFLRDRPDFDYDYLIDLTALDHVGEEKRFCMVYHLYSYSRRDLIRVKSRVLDDEVVPSMSSIWKAADWLEREVYDMFGIEFSEHPGLKRILLPDDWRGFPLRKDYDIKLQDQAWIRKHLRIRKVPG